MKRNLQSYISSEKDIYVSQLELKNEEFKLKEELFLIKKNLDKENMISILSEELSQNFTFLSKNY